MEEALVDWLLGSASVNTFVTNPSAITWVQRKRGLPLPSLVLTVVSRLPDVAMSGRTGLAQARVQFDCYAATYKAAKGLARAVGDRLAEIRNDDGDALQGAFPEGERDGFETETGGAGDLYRVSLDFIIWHG
jgi:hypothetical protein